jgi:hypothetical protein
VSNQHICTVGWSGIHSTSKDPYTIEIDALFASCQGLHNGQRVNVLINNVMDGVERIFVEPLDENDWEITAGP